MLPLIPPPDGSGEIGRRLAEIVALSREYRGYVWAQVFRQNLPQMGTILAVLLGSGSLLTQGSAASALFTLSLPVSRNRLLGVRAAAGLAELLAAAVVPALTVAVMSAAIGERYSVTTALVHAVCLFAAGAVFFSLALLLSTSFDDVWRPMLIALAAAAVALMLEQAFRTLGRVGIFAVMTGDSYFRTGHVPWIGLLASGAATLAMLYAAALNMDRRDF
jgi:hypothetical protein